MVLKKTVNGLIRSNLFLTVADKKAFQTLARKRGVSYSTLIRQSMAAFLGSKTEAFEFKQAEK